MGAGDNKKSSQDSRIGKTPTPHHRRNECLLHGTVAYQKCYQKVNGQANPGWGMSGTLKFDVN